MLCPDISSWTEIVMFKFEAIEMANIEAKQIPTLATIVEKVDFKRTFEI